MNGYIKARNRRGDSILMDYRYYQDLLKQVSGKVQLAITKEWSVAYTNHKDLNTNSDYQSIYEVAYEGQCWGIRAFYTDDVEQRGFYLAFSLGGFGELLGWGRSTERTGSY
jgi:LPS-assembly protein